MPGPGFGSPDAARANARPGHDDDLAGLARRPQVRDVMVRACSGARSSSLTASGAPAMCAGTVAPPSRAMPGGGSVRAGHSRRSRLSSLPQRERPRFGACGLRCLSRRPGAWRRAVLRRRRQCNAAAGPNYPRVLSLRHAAPEAPFRGIGRRAGGATEYEGGSALKKPFKLMLVASLALTGLLAAAPALAATPAANFGYYDNQPIEYQATAEVTSSPHAAQALAAGNLLYPI